MPANYTKNNTEYRTLSIAIHSTLIRPLGDLLDLLQCSSTWSSLKNKVWDNCPGCLRWGGIQFAVQNFGGDKSIKATFLESHEL